MTRSSTCTAKNGPGDLILVEGDDGSCVEHVKVEGATADYRSWHRAPTRDESEVCTPATLDRIADLCGPEILGPDAAQLFRTGRGPEHAKADRESLRVMRQVAQKPDVKVTVYRAVPEDVDAINPGDWVTLSRTYADIHGKSNIDGYKILEATVPASDLVSDGNSINEIGFSPADDTPAIASVLRKRSVAMSL